MYRIEARAARVVLEWDETHNCHAREGGHPGVLMKKLDSRFRGNDMGKMIDSTQSKTALEGKPGIGEARHSRHLACRHLAEHDRAQNIILPDADPHAVALHQIDAWRAGWMAQI